MTLRREANARNAQKSTGPKTSEGRKRSSRNATKHGFSAGSQVRAESGMARNSQACGEDPLRSAFHELDQVDALIRQVMIQAARAEDSATALDSIDYLRRLERYRSPRFTAFLKACRKIDRPD